MAVKKKAVKPLSTVRFDFVDAMENVCNEAIMMLQSVDTVLQLDTTMKPGTKEILQQRHDSLRNALIGED